MRTEWFKLEVLQDYYGEDKWPSLDAWLAGDKAKSLKLIEREADHEFIGMCREKLAQGVKLLRVHIVERPLTPYVAWEIEFYKRVNQKMAGEIVILADKGGLQDPDIPSGDLMIFDDHAAAMNAYDPTGRMVAETFCDQPGELLSLLGIKRRVLRAAKPLESYL